MLIVGIAGGSGSGKTTIAQALVDRLGEENVALISQDSYYRNNLDMPLEEREKINYDHPTAFENELLFLHLKQLKQGLSVEVPVYNFATHSRSADIVLIGAKPIVIVEGILILADAELRDIMDIKVFVHTDPDVRVLRRAIRDTTERGRSLESVDQQYLTTVKPMHETYVEPSKKHANIIIPEGGKNEVAINILTTWMERYLENDLAEAVK
jgi:uridine kinase